MPEEKSEQEKKVSLSLMAKDQEDVAVLSAYLQDAILVLNEVRFLQKEGKFIAILNRFRWEAQEDEEIRSKATYERVHTGLCIEHVKKISSQGIDLKQRDSFLSLLMLSSLEENQLEMLFAGGGTIRLDIEKISLFLHDLDQAWPTQWRPLHKTQMPGKDNLE